MKIVNKIKAFFKFKAEPQEIELSGAEIRNKGVFLHPIDDPKHVFFVKSNLVDIFINNNEELREEDITILDKEIVNGNDTEGGENTENITVEKRTVTRPLSYAHYMPSKKRFTIMLYQDEYDMLMDNINKHGYKKAEYFLACVHAAKKQSWDKEYKNIATTHKERYKNDKLNAQQAVTVARKKSKE